MTNEGDDIAERVANDLSFVRRALDLAPVIGLNEKACAILNAVPSQAIGGSLGRWCPDESLAAWNRVFLGYITGAVSYEEESVISRNDGSTLDVILTAAFPKRPDDQVRVVVGLVDVSERVAKERALARTQLELAHAARVATLGELMASIAHEVNQPLGAVVANGNAAYRWLNRPVPDIEEAKVAIQRMISEGGRASEIIARTRRMALKGGGDHSDFELKEMIAEAVDITRRQVAILGATLTLSGDAGAPVIRGDRIQLQQVVINLVVNAAQAMAEQPEGKRKIEVKVVNEPGQAHIQVSDTGPGLGGTDPARLFDAFFTTKKDGMGMGLSVSKSIVEAHGGTIGVVAREMGGTLFQVRLPMD
jgi:C4-dicarboxylate-specific signal transduction histidine kinase